MLHTYRLNGYNIALDAASGAIHAVDGLVFDILGLYESTAREEILRAMLEKYADSPEITREEILGALDDIDALKSAGKLFAPDRFASVTPKLGGEIKALCLHVSHACNLSCGYCFAGEGRYHGERALMPPEVGKRAVDFLIEHSGKRRNLEVDFFGGEPLLNWEMVKETVNYARSIEKANGKNFRFTLTTNGVLIDDDVIEFTSREMSNVVLSLDGRPEVHDRLRKTPGGAGSYELIVPNLRNLSTGAREELLYPGDVHPFQYGFYKRPAPHGGPGLCGTFHGARRLKKQRALRPDGGGFARTVRAIRAAGGGDAPPQEGGAAIFLLSFQH